MRRLLALALLTLLAACAGEPSDKTELTPVAFADLPGWSRDRQGEAFTVFAESCRTNARRANAYRTKLGEGVGNPIGWQAICMEAQRYALLGDDDARRFFETYFTAHRVSTEREPLGSLTGYYLPLLQGALVSDAQFKYPVYGLPEGYVKGQQLPERAAIDAGALSGRAPVLLYVEDPVMLFFVHIQGSGKVQLRDGRIVTLQYAGQNGHGYVAIGRPMREQGLLTEVSMQTIRDWLRANPEAAPGVMNLNPSYIFFTLNDKDATAKGALGLSLTPMRSLAIDDDRATYGVPTYLVTTHPNYYTQAEEPFTRLLVSQDTGGALHGPHRGDIFFGIGEEAEWAAGHQNTKGDVYWLLPK
jgi:membrane-bound lytic murein transglycosylase A